MNSLFEYYIKSSCYKRGLESNNLDLRFIKRLEKFMLIGKTKNFYINNLNKNK